MQQKKLNTFAKYFHFVFITFKYICRCLQVVAAPSLILLQLAQAVRIDPPSSTSSQCKFFQECNYLLPFFLKYDSKCFCSPLTGMILMVFIKEIEMTITLLRYKHPHPPSSLPAKKDQAKKFPIYLFKVST